MNQQRLTTIAPASSGDRPKAQVSRYSAERLLRHKVVLPALAIISTEKHNGRLVVRVEVPSPSEKPLHE